MGGKASGMFAELCVPRASPATLKDTAAADDQLWEALSPELPLSSPFPPSQ